MTKKERAYQHERQSRLTLTETDRAVNRHDAKRETRIPEQLPLIPPPQLSLF